MQAKETKVYNLTFDERVLKDTLIKAGINIPKDGPFSFTVQNGHLVITWSTEGVITLKENTDAGRS